MIVVKVEMWKGGDPNKKYDLGRTYIWNVGGTGKTGDYKVAVCRKGSYGKMDNVFDGKALRYAEVLNYPRESYNMWRLILRALRGAFPEERG